MYEIKIEHPALFLGEYRDDLYRITCEDENGNHHDMYYDDEEGVRQIISEALLEGTYTEEEIRNTYFPV